MRKCLIVSLSLIFLVAGCKSKVRTEKEAKEVVAPDFTLPKLTGETLTLSELRGKVIILNFWATWCPPCKAEIPFFVELQNEYKEHLTIVGVCLDRADRNNIKKFIEEMGINYHIVMSNPKVVKDYGGIRGIPTSFIIDKKGNIREAIVGYRPKEVFENKIKEYAAVK